VGRPAGTVNGLTRGVRARNEGPAGTARLPGALSRPTRPLAPGTARPYIARALSDDDQLTQDLASLRIPREASRPGPGGQATTARRWVRPVVVVAILLVVAGGGVWAVLSGAVAGLGQRLLTPEVRLAQVSLVSPSQADVTLVATGYVVSRRKATLAPKMMGRVARLYFDEGDRVKQGQVVAELERTDSEAQLAQARADAAAAHARAEQVRADLADVENKARRETALLGSGAGTAASAQDATSRVAVVRSQLAAGRADEEAQQRRVNTVQVQIENSRVRAPFDSTVLRKLSEVGEVVSPTPAGGVGGIFLVAALDQLEVEADVAESQLSKILSTPDAGSGDAATPAEITLDAFPDRRYRGHVSEVRPTVDRSKATVTVKVRFDDTTDGVLPDMGAKVNFLSRPLDRAALNQAPKRVVPSDAIVERGGRKVVLVVDGGLVRAVGVTVKGPVGTGQSEIVDGPQPGAQVIRAPSAEINTGSKVKPAEG
jgi:HlyD family secretion protein